MAYGLVWRFSLNSLIGAHQLAEGFIHKKSHLIQERFPNVQDLNH